VLGNLGTLLIDLGRHDEAHQTLEQALMLHRQVGNRRFEATALRACARLVRRAGGQLDEAERLQGLAENIVRGIGDTLYVAMYVCERGHLELARGRSGRSELEQASEMARTARAAAHGLVSHALERLERAVLAFEAARPLVHGECPEDLPVVQSGAWWSASDQAAEP